MTTIASPSPAEHAPPAEPAGGDPAPRARPAVAPSRGSKGWFGQLLLRLHFYAAILVGPFILIAATSGALYALSPSIDQVIYADELHAPVTATSLSLADQVEAANRYVGADQQIVAVRPAPNPGDTTRVMYADPSLGESETRAVFVDPGTAQIRGDLTAYGTSGALPFRAWVSDLHRSLHLGDIGRYYSELAASWLGIITLAGLGLWVARVRSARKKRDFVRPNNTYTGYRRILSWHAATGIWLLVGALFLSATGITWSQFGGTNVGDLRSALSWGTPSLTTTLGDGVAVAGSHDGHGGGAEGGGVAINPADFDRVLAVGEEVNINTGLVEIRPPKNAESAWVVQEIQRSIPTEVDAVAVNGSTMQVTDRVDFAEFGIPAKLTRWGIDTHSGTMFGLPNQLLLFMTALGIIVMTVWGYVMWWQRRPTKTSNRPGRAPERGALRRAPWWGVALVIAVGVAIGLVLPLVGWPLVAFVVIDTIIGWRARRSAAVAR